MGQQTILIESLDLTQATVDREAAIIRNVKLSGRRSRNIHKRHGKPIVYSDASIEQSASLFEGCPVTVRGGHDRSRRDYTSQNGQLRAGRVADLGTDKAASRFDWHLNTADPLTPKILEDAEKFPANCPLSQEVMEWAESVGDEAVIIESLTKDPMKVGVALVYRGGLNDTLFESIAEDETVEIKTKEELTAHFPRLCEELSECACAKVQAETDDLAAKLMTAIAEREALQAELEKLKGQLEEFQARDARLEHISEITAEAKKILGEQYDPPEQLLEDLLGLYEGERYKRVLTSMGELLTQAQGEAEDTTEQPTSASGLSAKRTDNGRRRVGVHNRRY